MKAGKAVTAGQAGQGGAGEASDKGQMNDHALIVRGTLPAHSVTREDSAGSGGWCQDF